MSDPRLQLARDGTCTLSCLRSALDGLFTMIWVVLTIVQLPLYVGFQLKSTGAMSIVDLIADIIFWS